MTLHKLERRNYGRKLLVSIKCQNLHSFKEGLILLCQSILEMRRITHLHVSAHFTIPLNQFLDIWRESLKMGYSRKSQTKDWGYTFLKNPMEFLDLSLYTWKFQRKQAFSTPWKFCKIVWKSKWLSKIKTLGNSTWFFLDHHWKFHFFFNWPMAFLHASSSIILEIRYHQPHLFGFFLE